MTGWEESTGWGEVQATGWGDEEPAPAGGDDDGEAAVDHNDDAAQDDGNANNEEDDGNKREEEEDNNNMSDDDQYESDDMDEDDAYYSSIVEETGRDGADVQPPEKNSLNDLFRLPYDLMYRGSFHGAKVHAAREDRLLLVNLQTRAGAGDFPSQLQNRDLWANETVSKVVKDNFVFMLLQKRKHYSYSDECSKVSTFYKLHDDGQLPVVLVLDPITGELLAKRSGAMTPDEFMEFVVEYTKSKPSTLSKPCFVKKTPTTVGAGGEEQEQASASAAAAVEEQPASDSSEPAAEAVEQEPEIPDEDSAAADGASSEQEPAPVPESPADAVDDDDEPMEGEKMYSLRIRFPDGTMVAKEFGCNRRVASLFAFCRSAVHGGVEAEMKAFRIMRFVGRALEAIQDGGGATFENLGLNRAAVSVVFDT